MRRYWPIAWLLILGVVRLSAQDSDSVREVTYVKNFDQYFFMGPVLKKRELVFNISSLKDENSSVAFRPNVSYGIGWNVNIFDVSLEASVSIPVGIKNVSRFGESTAKDFQFGALSRRFAADAYWQKYSGFYYTYPSLNVPNNKPFPRRADVDTRNFGGSFTYVLNNKKFSLRSSYTFLDEQLVSKGSFLVGCIVSAFTVNGDSSLIPKALHANNPKANVSEVHFSSLGIAPGYSYNLVFSHFFVNATLLVGPAHYWVRYYLESSTAHNDIQINAYTALRVAIGYNSHQFYTGLSYAAQGREVVSENIQFSNSINSFKLVVGWRFRERGMLTKSVMELVPELLRSR